MFYSFLKKYRTGLFIVFFILQAVVNYAQADLLPTGMTSLIDSIKDVFTGDFVKSILVICLAGCAIAYGFNKDNEKMKRNIIAIGVACAILMAASEIVKKITEAAQS
jgi:type IV secretory pathway VirB2 component (pilin)